MIEFLMSLERAVEHSLFVTNTRAVKCSGVVVSASRLFPAPSDYPSSSGSARLVVIVVVVVTAVLRLFDIQQRRRRR